MHPGFSHPTRLREETRARTPPGERVEELADELGVAPASPYRWKQQALIDAGRKPGVKSDEPDELQRSRRRITELEPELVAVKAASTLFEAERPIRPTGSAPSLGD